MEDVMETCYLDSVTMCFRGYKCESCPRQRIEDNTPSLRDIIETDSNPRSNKV